MLEKDIERKVSEYAKSLGWLGFKFVSPSNRGVPDRIYMKKGKVIFIEFKKEGGKLSSMQRRYIALIRAHDIQVEIVWSVEEGVELFNKMELKC